ncbi:MAG: MgtC/SapB family protein [Longimicrobiales bacterium]
MNFIGIDALGTGAVLGRLFLAALLGGLIGFEREASGKPAGFRTNLLICLGAALITEISIAIAHDALVQQPGRADPGRIAAQIVSGIGFLGAGTIMQTRGSVVGLTTAATMWVVAAIGMAVGAGAFAMAGTATAITLLALRVLHRLDDQLLPNRFGEHTLVIESDAQIEAIEIENALSETGVDLRLLQIERRGDRRLFTYRARGAAVSAAMRAAVSAHPRIQKITLD